MSPLWKHFLFAVSILTSQEFNLCFLSYFYLCVTNYICIFNTLSFFVLFSMSGFSFASPFLVYDSLLIVILSPFI